jgi:hypothetical protein
VKQLHVFAFILAVILLSSCSQSLTSGSLLVSGSTGTSTDTNSGDDPIEDPNAPLEINVPNSNLSAAIDDTDKIEISGTCNDLNRKKNRILVEVFSGENLTDNPYISNAISDKCLAANGAVTGNGTAVDDTCFFVTKGAGLVEVEGPVQRSFPQCNNGQFSFIVRLGANLNNNTLTQGRSYRIRVKLRTLDGQIADSEWFDRIYVTRDLSTPSFTKLTASSSSYSCSLEMLPARFNQNITYMLERTMTGVSSTATASLFSSAINSTDVRASSYNDNNLDPAISTRIIAGASYSYKLTNFDVTSYSGGFSYLTPLTQTSTSVTCSIDKPTIAQSRAPTNTPISIPGGTGPTCNFAYISPVNPGLSATPPSTSVRWAFSTLKGWTQLNSDYNEIIPSPTVNLSACTTSVCTATGLAFPFGDGLAASQTYYYAVQEFDSPSVPVAGAAQVAPKGKWSAEVACTTPADP